MRLTDHFTVEELTFSQLGARLGLDNTPPPELIPTLLQTAQRMEDVRALLGRSITVLSGYRSAEVNKAVGGAKNSAHLTGHAVDFTCPGYGSPQAVFDTIRESSIRFDQIIMEFGQWVHISFAPAMRRSCLTAKKVGKETVYETTK